MRRDRRGGFADDVERQAWRKRRARQRRESVWFGLGMFGLVGWSVAVPTLIGIAVGVWVDSGAADPGTSWTLTGLGIGVGVGCAIAWFWVRRESDGGPEPAEDPHTAREEQP